MRNTKVNCGLLAGLIFITLIFYACKKDTKGGQINIAGNWATSFKYDSTEVFNQVYEFNADSTVQITKTVNDEATGKLLGYQYLSNGKFHLSGDRLELYNLVTLYDNQAGTNYVPLDKLTPLITDTLQSYTIVINAASNSFYFYYPPCPPSADCITQFIYKKQ